MSIDIELIKKLAGLLNMNSVVANVPVINKPEQSAPCGCDAETSGSNMRKFIDATTFEEIEEEDEDGEWANSTDHFDGKRRDHGQPTGAVVDTSLRRHLGAKAMPVRIEESDENSEDEEDEEDEEKSAEEELEEAFVNEGMKDKLKIMALLGITALGGNYAANAISPINSPLGKALSQAASQGDQEAAQYLKRLGAIVDNDISTLKMLNFKYLDEPAAMHTTESMMESYKRHKDRTKERQKQRIKNKAKDKVIATVGGGNLKGMASVEEASVPVQKVAKLPSLPNKKAYDLEKASETKKKVSLKPEPWKNKKETKEMVKESVDLNKLKKNAGLL
jgi:hypothetical protein